MGLKSFGNVDFRSPISTRKGPVDDSLNIHNRRIRSAEIVNSFTNKLA